MSNKNILTPRKTLNKAFLKMKPLRSDITLFKNNLVQLLDDCNDSESEEFHKNLLSTFLYKTYYSDKHFINTKGRNDLVIHNGKDAKSPVGVIVETKKPGNKSEMLRPANVNAKAMQELVLYYLRERITLNNLQLKYLIATDIFEWYIFDAQLFEKLFAQNKKLVQLFNDFEAGRLGGNKTEFFYKEVAQPAIEAVKENIIFTHFDISEYEKPLRNSEITDDNKLIALQKIFSPEHLLKKQFSNDSNSLNKAFYNELLHIIGLTEIKDGSKKIITRKKEQERNAGSLLENAISQIDNLDKFSVIPNPSRFGETSEERYFNLGLELCITWINRILFLKLLEAQLLSYHKGNPEFRFMSIHKISSFDELNQLFFSVLAKLPDERNARVKARFAKVPYLNSSLFEQSEIEQQSIFISNLSDEELLPLIANSVLRRSDKYSKAKDVSSLEYLFEFLDAYDFSSDGSGEIQEDNKNLINASVLGLIFEKINGYRDGSFFTPGFITMYMCHETIRRAVVQKFNETKGWNCNNLDELYNKIEDTAEANRIVNSIKICDPAVGSGHFLVSALNELISIKSELRILCDREGRRLKEYNVEIENDELILTDEDGEIFEYKPGNNESQRVQEALFHEKQTLIENCLFGVDINPNSVKICRLRLWIELLKNAYYKDSVNPSTPLRMTELETLPNIDINIKCGNSLISR
ncbi:MAG TPA: class I SAM-dependent DNA methyltransferase, partial [Bacteroidales bacterium]|nr:class I SAM-dependent DNA methyltransferase [Bacteroidales bacterium]